MSRMPSDAGSKKQQRLADRANTLLFTEQFNAQYPTEKDCVEKLKESFAVDGLIICHFCNSSKTEKIDLRSFKCHDCKKYFFFTAGTFFDHVRHIKALMLAIWLLGNGVRFSASHFAELAGIAKSTAIGMVKKVALLMYRTMGDAEDSLNSSEFAKIFIRRSLCTPALEHPRAEQRCAEDEYLANSPEVQIAAHEKLLSALSNIETTIYHHLTPSPQDLDALEMQLKMETRVISAAVSSLELAGLIERAGGDKYMRPEHKIFVPPKSGDKDCPPEQEIYAQSVVAFIQSSMHGIARKYLQLYVAIYLCFANRKKWSVGSILSACGRSKPIYLSEIQAFVTPLFVKVGRLDSAA
jgi:transposase-like protein